MKINNCFALGEITFRKGNSIPSPNWKIKWKNWNNYCHDNQEQNDIINDVKKTINITKMGNYKKLERDTQNKVIGGVCSGLGAYFDIDPAIIRALFVLFFFCAGSGMLAYLIMWIVMPARRNDAPKADNFYTNDANETSEEQQMTQTPKAGDHKSALVIGFLFIGVGICFLLGNLIPAFDWNTFWPLILIAFGLMLIIPFSKKNEK